MKYALLLLVVVASCARSSSKPVVTPPAAGPAASYSAACACIAAGRSWSADQCSDDCVADTWCYGAGNPAAPTCPAEAPEEGGGEF